MFIAIGIWWCRYVRSIKNTFPLKIMESWKNTNVISLKFDSRLHASLDLLSLKCNWKVHWGLNFDIDPSMDIYGSLYDNDFVFEGSMETNTYQKQSKYTTAIR